MPMIGVYIGKELFTKLSEKKPADKTLPQYLREFLTEHFKTRLKPSIDAVCSRCGHAWTKKTNAPKRCPKCKSAKWDDRVTP